MHFSLFFRKKNCSVQTAEETVKLKQRELTRTDNETSACADNAAQRAKVS